MSAPTVTKIKGVESIKGLEGNEGNLKIRW
jgi:hypothetical protein